MIEFNNVTRSYGNKVAVDQLCLTVEPGELFALLGPNGAGKTTTIKMLVGLLRPDSGTVVVEGEDADGNHTAYNIVEETRMATRQIGYVPDQPFLYDKLTGREFLEFAGQMRGFTQKKIRDRIEREAENFQLHEFLDDLTETYSHGMKQRVVFASAMLHDPKVLVIDEPMVGLDPHSVRLVKDLLRSLSAAGSCIFMSTHTLSVAEEIAHRIGIVNQGHMHFLGTVSQLQEELASPHEALEPLFLELTGSNGQAVSQSPHHSSRANQP